MYDPACHGTSGALARADILLDRNTLAARLALSDPGRIYALLGRDVLPLPPPIYIAPQSPRWRTSDIDAWLEDCARSGDWADTSSARAVALAAKRGGPGPRRPRKTRPPDEPGLLRLPAAVRHLGVSRTKFFEMKREGKLPEPVVFSPRDLRWRKSELDAWIAAGGAR